MKLKGKGSPAFRPQEDRRNTITQGCWAVHIHDVRYARTPSGEHLANSTTGELAWETIFENEYGNQISLIMWTTDKGLWVFKELCKACRISPKTSTAFGQTVTDLVPVEKLIGTRLVICVAGLYQSFNGKYVDNIIKHVVLPDKMMPYYDDTIPKIPGDPRRGENPHGTIFALYNEMIKKPQQELNFQQEKDIFD